MKNEEPEANWEWEIKPETKWYSLQLAELLNYKDLLISFFRRELLSGYHQSVIGVFWIILQPILTTLFYFIVFSRIVRVSTDGLPPVLFYLSGNIIWAFFSDCMTGTMFSFLFNAHIFSKVYFPRLIVPLSMVLTHTVRFGIQLLLFLLIYFIYSVCYTHITPSVYIFILPFLVLQVAAFSLGVGLILSVYVARYRDIEHLMNFFLRLFMFITPVVYPSSIVPEKYKVLFWLNPLTPVIETFRSVFFHHYPPHLHYLFISSAVAVITLVLGLVVFKQQEITIMDTI